MAPSQLHNQELLLSSPGERFKTLLGLDFWVLKEPRAEKTSTLGRKSGARN